MLYVRPRSDISSGLQYLDRMDGEIWHGRRYSPQEKSAIFEIDTRTLAELPDAVRRPNPATLRVLRGYDTGIDAGLLPMTAENAERGRAAGQRASPSCGW